MTIEDPRIDPRLVPPGSRAVIKGERQQDTYRPLPSVHLPDGKVITRWSPTPEERRRILEGEDVYLTVLTFNKPIQPQLVTIGPIDWTSME
jgi:hypothetical protein